MSGFIYYLFGVTTIIIQVEKMNTFATRCHELFVAGFEQKSQELEIFLRRKAQHQIIEEQDLKRFSFELTSYHSAEVSQLATYYNSSIEFGLTEKVASTRLKQHGHNTVEVKRNWPLWVKFVRSFFVWFSPLLWVATVLMIITWKVMPLRFVRNYYVIVVVLLLSMILSTSLVVFWREWQSTEALHHSQACITQRKCWVVRGGRTLEILSSELVVGDLVILHPGNRVPADLRLATSTGMQVDKSVLTGDTQPVSVAPTALPSDISFLAANNTVFMGTRVLEGTGTGIVIATGRSTQIGKIAAQPQRAPPHNMIRREIFRAVTLISIAAIIGVVIMVVCWAFYYQYRLSKLRRVSTFLIDIMNVLVTFVPMGLPVVINLGLSILARRLANECHVFSRHCGGLIALGAATVLIVDAAAFSEWNYDDNDQASVAGRGNDVESCRSNVPRESIVQGAVQQLRGGGILLVMVSSDAEQVTLGTATDMGLLIGAMHYLATLHRALGGAMRFHNSNASIMVSGYELDRMTPVEWEYVFSHGSVVFSSTAPAQKLLIVDKFHGHGHIVAATGSGISDCPTLQRADVGIVFNNATDVARGMADVILLNDDFADIVHGVKMGRLKAENIRKAVAHMISAGCWPLILSALVFFFLGIPQPILLLHTIWIGCTSDIFCGLALMCERAERDLMTKPPRHLHTARLLDGNVLLYSYIFYGNMAAFGAFFNYFAYMRGRGDTSGTTLPAGYRFDQLLFDFKFANNIHTAQGRDQIDAWQEASSVFLLTVVMAQLGQLLTIRLKKPYFYNALTLNQWDDVFSIQWPVVFAIIGSFVTTVVFLYTPVLNEYCAARPLSAYWWGLAVGWSVLWFVVAEIRKWRIALFPDSWIARRAW